MLTALEQDGQLWRAELLQTDVASPRTGRIFSKEELVSALLAIDPDNSLWIGQLGERQNWKPGTGHTVDLAYVSHRVRELKLEDDRLVGWIQILDTPQGKIVQSLLAQGCKLGLKLLCHGFVDTNHRVSNIDIVGVDIDTFTQEEFVGL